MTCSREEESPVWVTGIGVMSSAGNTPDSVLQAMRDELTGVQPDEALGGIATGRMKEVVREHAARHLDGSAACFLAAANRAWTNARLTDARLNAGRADVVEGSSLGVLPGALSTFASRLCAPGQRAHRPTDLIRFMPGAGGAAFAQQQGLTGSVLHLSAGSVASACAIGEGWRRIARGDADVVVVGGADCPLQNDIVETFRASGALSSHPQGEPPCRPFDERRSGTVLGEGAAALILESAAHASRRGALPRAVITGYGFSCETYSMIAPNPDGEGVFCAMRDALAGSDIRDVQWIKAHGTGTRTNDLAECNGLSRLFGESLPAIPITSLKSTFGHTLGASGAIEAVAAIICMENGFLPATLGTSRPDPALPCCRITTKMEELAVRRALLLSESFGGRCAAIAISRN